MSYIGILGVFWYQFKTSIWKKYSKSKQTKSSGFVKLGVWWAERDEYQLKEIFRRIVMMQMLFH